jgi:hypothetical protein
MMRVSRVLSLAIVPGSIAAGLLLGVSVENLCDAGRLRIGRFEYRMPKAGIETAKFTVTVERLQSGNFRFTGEASGFNQKWESTATPLFQPVSAMLRMQRRDGKMYSMNLKYDDGRVTGLQEKESSTADRIDDHVPPGTLDQRIDWAAAMARRLDIGDKLAFTVYDPATGVSRVTGEMARAERMQVPTGTYDTMRVIYQIEKSKGTERYEVLASKTEPRVMIREDFPDGTTSELIGIE